MKKVVIITGASSGIGHETAVYLSQKGFDIVLVARNKEKLYGVAQEIMKLGGRPLIIPTDVSKIEEFEKMIEIVMDKYGEVDVLINNAGLMPLSLIKDGKLQKWHNAVDVNIKGVINGVSLVLPYMRSENKGIIINIGSTVSQEVPPYGVIYSATKNAVKVISEGLYKELAMEQSNVRVAHLSLGPTDTDIINNSNDLSIAEQFKHFKVSKFTPRDVAELIYRIIEDNPTNRFTDITTYP
ncbi:SDR family oxidoreductase [Bacillus altitudinis]|uniref:SDR family oxidoreductase n=1 Tax=Bacillus altitudinis TaxID=293387 RepID=UPI00228321BD|nr:SDR family oxidoreductase [Bacillus altitudinis]MCY7454001.1 SDR family oxidoreductase [Bacillus altitudinis]